jgi:hypothetical protein
MSKLPNIDTRERLSQYWDDLVELIKHGEISPAQARFFLKQLFVNASGAPPMLKERHWQTCLQRVRGAIPTLSGTLHRH